MATRLKKLKITKIALVPAGANQHAHVLLYKSASPVKGEPMDTVTKAVHEATLADLAAAKAVIATLQEQVVKLTPPDPNEIWKGVSPVLKARFEEQERRTQQAEEAVAVEKAAREKVLYIAKARGYKYLPINPDDDWEVFKGIASLPEAQQVRLETLFTAAEELGRKARLTQSWGRTSGGDTGEGTPLARLEAFARDAVVKGLAKTEAEGMQQAVREHPELYRQHSRLVQQEERD